MQVELRTPWPPSVNRYWRMARGRFYIAKPGIEFREAVRDLVFEKMLDRQMKGRLSIEIEAYAPDNRRRDMDNIQKAILDSIQHSELIDDDNQFDIIRIQRCLVHPGAGWCRLTITELSDVEVARLAVRAARDALAAAERHLTELAV